jgi:glyoxylase-like metal-dependent hydrolase (beta-lactamase superfamily II)
MKVVRLPGIHHDGNVVLVSGSLGHLLINAGTSWYQALQVERITGQLDGQKLDRILLTSRRFPVSGGAAHVSQAFDGVPVHIHPDGQAALETGDFFTTWANRYDSDMPRTITESLTEEDVFPMGVGEVIPVCLPGHTGDGMGFHLPHLSTLVVGALLPRADRPTRWDLPGGSLMDVISSFKRMKRLEVTSIVPLQGPAIRGADHVRDVLNRHLQFFEEAVANEGQPPISWDRPASTAVWFTPRTPWPLDEQESV